MIDVILRVITGEPAAWHTLWSTAEPIARKIARKSRYTGRISERDDERDRIALTVMERLRADDYRALRAFVAAHARQGGSFETWLTTIVVRCARDYVRAHPEYVDRRGEHGPESARALWAQIDSMPDSGPPGSYRDIMIRLRAVEALERARRILTAEQYEAVRLRTLDLDHEDIAEQLGLASDEVARKLVRSGLGRLRDRLVEEEQQEETEETS